MADPLFGPEIRLMLAENNEEGMREFWDERAREDALAMQRQARQHGRSGYSLFSYVDAGDTRLAVAGGRANKIENGGWW